MANQKKWKTKPFWKRIEWEGKRSLHTGGQCSKKDLELWKEPLVLVLVGSFCPNGICGCETWPVQVKSFSGEVTRHYLHEGEEGSVTQEGGTQLCFIRAAQNRQGPMGTCRGRGAGHTLWGRDCWEERRGLGEERGMTFNSTEGLVTWLLHWNSFL